MAEFVVIEITKPLPEQAVAESTYKIKGTVKLFDAVGAPPWVYAQVQRKEWYKPDWAEKVDYLRAWTIPITGGFSIEFKPEKEGEYQVIVVATPAPLSLPAVGLFPILAESDAMKVSVGQRPPAVFRFSGVTIDGSKVSLTDHDADSKLLIQKKTTDSLEIIPSFEWVGPKKAASISIKAGYRDLAGGFTPKTDAYTATIELPESPDTPYSGAAKTPIKVPLTASGGQTDGAIEVVLKISGFPDYISHIWNVYATEPAVVSFRFSAIIIDGKTVSLGNHDADSGLLLAKTTADSLSITPAFEWQGSKKAASISIKAGYRDLAGGFTPKSQAYTATFELPDSIDKKYSGQLTSPITVPLTASGGQTDGAIEVVLKISGFPDYITHIWNVFSTKEVERQVLEVDITPPEGGYVTTEPKAAEGHPEEKWYNDHTGKFEYGAKVQVTAHPNTSYGFDHWSDEILGGTSNKNPEYVAGVMDSHKAVKAHFREVVEYKGSIIRVELEYNESRGVAPVSNVEQGKRGLVHVRGRNDTPTNQTLGIAWVVSDPNGRVVERHENDWASGFVGSGQDRPFIGGRFNLDTLGEYFIDIALYMNSGNPVQVNSYSGVLCAVQKVVAGYTLSITVNPSGAGSVAKYPDKATYNEWEVVNLTATPASGYKFDHWSGDASGYSSAIGISMDRNKSVVANFVKLLPDPGTKVTFRVRTKGEPFNTDYLNVYHYDYFGNIWYDPLNPRQPGDVISVYSTSQGMMSAYCRNRLTGQWGEQKFSKVFLAVDGGEYEWDIASGDVMWLNR